MKQKRKAISPIIATLILIVITVIAGVFLYSFVSGYMSTLSPTASSPPNVQFVSANYTKVSNNYNLTYIIYNAGSTSVTFQSTATVYFSNGTYFATGNVGGGPKGGSAPTIAPGETLEIQINASISSSGNYYAKLVTTSGYTIQTPTVYIP
jgi:flagellin-like protein